MKNKKNEKELKQKEMEKYYTTFYANKKLKINPNFMPTKIHPDCLFKSNNTIYAVEATGYFYQQETDFSNRIAHKVNKVLNNDKYLYDIYKTIGKRPLLNIIDAIYYDNLLNLINDLINQVEVIEEINIDNDYYYNNDDVVYNSLIDNNLEKNTVASFFEKINKNRDEYRFKVILKKKYLLPIKLILIYDKNISYNTKKTFVPTVSFIEDDNYNFKSLKSLIENKDRKLLGIYRSELIKNNITYDKFILLIHPLDFPIDILPELIYNQLKNTFIESNYDEIAIILRDKLMIVNKYKYELY